MQLRKRIAAALALATAAGAVGLTLAPTPVTAAAPAPVILNSDVPTSANASWLETQNLTDGGHNRIVQATFLVQHAEGRTITGVKADFNWNSTDDTPGAAVIPAGSSGSHNVEVDRFTPSAGAMQTSRVVARINVGNGPNSSGRAFSSPFRMRVVDSTGEQSATVSATIRFVEEGQSTGSQDYPSIRDIVPSTYTNVEPGAAVSFQIRCDDPDTNFLSDDDECDRANPRWRRLDNGDTITLPQFGAVEDNSTQTITTTAPSTNGHWVFEVHLCNEDNNCPTSGGGSPWWRLGSVAVNDAASSLTGSIAFTGSAVKASSPPSVNEDEVANATATVAEAGGAGATVQVIEWNKDHNAGASATFEERYYTVPTNSGGNISTPHVSTVSGSLSRPVSTSTPGLKTVQVRVTDNGALDAADDIRRQATITSGQLRVNAIPTAADVSKTVAEDSGLTTITLNGSDSDNQPAPLVYSLVTGLSVPSLGTLGAISGNTIQFTPAANANGTATFTYRVRDGSTSTVAANSFSNTATVTVTVTPVNDLPTVHAKSLTTNEDTAGTVQLTGSDVENGPNLTWSLNPGGQATNGTASCPASGLCTYTPNANFNGTDSFVVRGTDANGGFGTATVSVTVTAVNDAPNATPQTVTVPEDAVNHPITLAGSDIDNAVLGFTAPIDDVDHGTLSCLGASCTYTPDADFHGLDSFTFRVDDGPLQSAEATVTINVQSINDGPIATDVPDAVADEDVPTPIAATGTDVDGDTVTVDSASDPAFGTTQVTGPNEVTYTGDLDFHGVDSYEFTVVDGNGGSDTGLVSVTVNPVNDAPVVADQTFTIDEDTPTLLSIAAGDVDGDLLGWAVSGGAGAGTVFGTGPDVVYVPDLDAHGTDTFEVTVDDGNGGTDTATITVQVTAVNDQPRAEALVATTAEDTAVDVTLVASDPADGDILTFTAPVLDAAHGTVACTAAACTYTPDADFHGSDLFSYSVSDGNGGGDVASVSVTVTPVNDAPTAVGAAVTTEEDQAVAVELGASDVDGDPVTFTYGTASDGTVSGTGPNAVYTPNPNFNGTDSFGFTVDDGNGGTDSAVAAISVDAVNDAPVATGGSVATEEETPVSFTLGGSDVDDSSLTFTVLEATNGSLSCDPDGACSYTPPDDFTGSTALQYEVSDGSLSAIGVFTILVDPVNDLPVPAASAVITAEDTAVAFQLAATDTEDDTLTYAVVAQPASGAVVCSTEGSCTYTPAANQHGTETFEWSVSDGGATVTSIGVVTVVPVNDAPQALDVAAETQEDTAVTLLLLASDVEGDAITYSVETPPSHGTVSIAGNVATYTPATDYTGTDLFTYRATDASGAFTVARASVVVDEVPMIGTNLVGDAAVARVLVNLLGNVVQGAITVFPKMSATLRTDLGAPLAGRTITFTIGGNVVCSAVTDADGRGECSGSAALAALLNLGYQVSFAGDADHSASTARGPILQILALRL